MPLLPTLYVLKMSNVRYNLIKITDDDDDEEIFIEALLQMNRALDIKLL